MNPSGALDITTTKQSTAKHNKTVFIFYGMYSNFITWNFLLDLMLNILYHIHFIDTSVYSISPGAFGVQCVDLTGEQDLLGRFYSECYFSF